MELLIKRLSGWRQAVQVLACGCASKSGKSMRDFRAKKGELTRCPSHGLQKTRRVESTDWSK